MAAQTEASTINEFCLAHGISRRTFYNLQRSGKAPRVMQIGTAVRVSREAAAEWRAREADHGATDDASLKSETA